MWFIPPGELFHKSEFHGNVKQIVKYYKMRWGVEVEFRGLKQTLDKHTLKCRNSERLLVELDWSIRAMAVAELIALREQIGNASERDLDADYDPQDRSLANTMRALRKCMRQLHKGLQRPGFPRESPSADE